MAQPTPTSVGTFIRPIEIGIKDGCIQLILRDLDGATHVDGLTHEQSIDFATKILNYRKKR